MRNIISIIIVFVLSSISLYSQNNEDNFISPFWNFYSSNYLNSPAAGKGNTGIASENDITGFLLNPASIKLDTKFQINVQYTFKTSNKWLGSDNMSLKQQLFSGSAGIGYKINDNINIGLVYNNPSGYYFGSEIIKTDEFGNELEGYDFFYNVAVHSINIPFSYSGEKIKAGINLNYLHSRYTIPGEYLSTITHPDGYNTGNDFHASANFIVLQAGLIFNIAEHLSLGLSGSSGGRSKVTHVYPDGESTDSFINIYPWKLGAGIQYEVPKTGWKLLADYNYAKTSDSKMLKDRNDFHIGFENDINKSWTIRGGFFTLFDYRSEDIDYYEAAGEYDQFFFTAGFSFKKNNIIWNLALLSSALSTGSVKNTYINTGLTLNLK